MSSEKPIRLGVVGAGIIGTIHMNHFSAIPGVKVVAVADARRPLAEEAAEKFAIPAIYATSDDLIADEQVDAVIIGTPNKYHAQAAVAALEAGKHVLLEKPMALHTEDAKKIVRAQRATGRQLMVGHQFRWTWWARQAKARVERGDLGQIYYAKCGWFRRKGIPGWGTWFTQKAISGGGPLIDVGVHLLDLTLWLMGNPKPVAVFGATYAAFGPEKRGIGTWGKPDFNGTFDVEDLASALIRFEDGATLTLEVSWAINKDTDSEPFVHLAGHDAGISVQHGRRKFLAEVNNEAVEEDFTPPADIENERDALSKHFIECVRENKEPISTAWSGLVNNMVLDAIYQSSKTGEVVKLDWSDI